ncbi:MAG: hypothetical protein R6V83_00575 [Candidatus Thorarchaeota archaeon]
MEPDINEATPTTNEVPSGLQNRDDSDTSQNSLPTTTVRRNALDLVDVAKIELGSPFPDFVAVSYAFGCIRQEGGPYEHHSDGGISDNQHDRVESSTC